MSEYDKIEFTINGTQQVLSWDDVATKLGLQDLQRNISDTAEAIDTSWLIFGTTLVFIMQAGFTMIEVGSVRIKNTKSILIKNLLDCCIGSVLFYFYGWAFAFGQGNGFIGLDGFAIKSGMNETEISSEYYAKWAFQFTFCATASTIVSGAVAERTQLLAYLIYTFFLATIIYPPVAHWAWAPEGWASPFNANPLFDIGVIDYAGVNAVHILGGTCAILGAYLVGPRQGRFDKSKALAKQNAVFQCLGTLMLWFGWYGFNCGSTHRLGGPITKSAAKIAVATTISGAVSGSTTILLNFFLDRKFDPAIVCNGILAGLVSVNGACAVVLPYSAFIIGVIGAHVYYFGSKALEWMQIDDVVDASAVHLFCGIWGTIACSIFCDHSSFLDAYEGATKMSNGAGLLYDAVKGGKMLAAHLLFLLVVLAYVCLIILPLFLILKKLRLLRINNIEESKGQDKVMHGGVAYENQVAA